MKKEIKKLVKRKHFRKIEELWDGNVADNPIDEVENLVYDFELDGGPQILRLGHSSKRSENSVIAELDWINYLADNGVRACRPIPSKNGNITEVIDVGESYFTAVVFERAPGDFIQSSSFENFDKDFSEAWGRLIGKMHRLTKDYDPSHLAEPRPHWRSEEFLERAQKYMPPDQHEILDELESQIDKITAIPKTRDTYGLIHDDLDPTNFFVKDGKITVFDFEDCRYNYFLADLSVAIPLYSPIYEQSGWEEKLIQFFINFISGYAEETKIDLDLLALIPDYLKYINMGCAIFSYEVDEYNRNLYNDWFELVLDIYKNGHPLFDFDFYKAVIAHE